MRMKLVRIILGAILLYFAVDRLYFFVKFGDFFYLLPGLILLTICVLLFATRISMLSIFSTLFGAISIIVSIVVSIIGRIGISASVHSVIVMLILLTIGVLVILPLKFYRKSSVRKISYTSLAILLLALAFYYLFFFKLSPRGEFAGDFSVIPMYVLGSLLLGSLCIPFLIIKSVLSRKS